jgi:NAD(P)-dependent dehydrogenase (short-subunit alcohol dehydrogenase family)
VSNSLELNGRRALVTGGTKGVGEAVVIALRDVGAKVKPIHAPLAAWDHLVFMGHRRDA